MWNTLSRHQINDNVKDTRTGLLDSDLDDIRENLHLNLVSLAPFVFKLLEQVHPEYAFLEPPPFTAHLHETFWRLLLQQIVDMTDDDISLDIEHMRGKEFVLPPIKSTVTSRGKKHAAGSWDGRDSKGKRTLPVFLSPS